MVVKTLVLFGIDCHSFHNAVNKVVVKQFGILVSKHEFSLAIVHHENQVFGFSDLNLMLVVVNDIHFVHNAVVSLANYLVTVLHKPHLPDLVDALLFCFRPGSVGKVCGQEHQRVHEG